MVWVEAHIFEKSEQLGGKLAQTIPWERLSKAVWEMEVERFKKSENLRVHLDVSMTQEKMEQLKATANA